MIQATFAVRDRVRLKSGSPRLTVVSVDEDNVTVTWAGEKDIETSTFPAVCLKKSR
jgi:uncharacterized protein YodC (DUF2158 family)